MISIEYHLFPFGPNIVSFRSSDKEERASSRTLNAVVKASSTFPLPKNFSARVVASIPPLGMSLPVRAAFRLPSDKLYVKTRFIPSSFSVAFSNLPSAAF